MRATADELTVPPASGVPAGASVSAPIVNGRKLSHQHDSLIPSHGVPADRDASLLLKAAPVPTEADATSHVVTVLDQESLGACTGKRRRRQHQRWAASGRHRVSVAGL